MKLKFSTIYLLRFLIHEIEFMVIIWAYHLVEI